MRILFHSIFLFCFLKGKLILHCYEVTFLKKERKIKTIIIKPPTSRKEVLPSLPLPPLQAFSHVLRKNPPTIPPAKRSEIQPTRPFVDWIPFWSLVSAAGSKTREGEAFLLVYLFSVGWLCLLWLFFLKLLWFSPPYPEISSLEQSYCLKPEKEKMYVWYIPTTPTAT